MQSILAVNCGSVNTTAYFIERKNERFRLTATGQTASTYGSPLYDITLGITESIRQIEQSMQRILLAPGGWPLTPQSSPRQGVDAFVVVSSAGPSLRLALAGLMQQVSLTSARRAAVTTYASVVATLPLEALPGRHAPLESRLKMLLAAEPDVLLLVGGVDGGARDSVLKIANLAAMALQVIKNESRPHIVYAGNRDLRPQVAEILGSLTSLTAVDNVRPTLDVENLSPVHLELEKLYLQHKMTQLPGFKKLSGWTRHPIIPVYKSFEKTIAYIGRQNNLQVMGVDVGSGATMVSTYAHNQAHTIVRSDAGIGHSAASLLKKIPISRIHRWVPFDVTPDEVRNLLLNKSLYPASLPATPLELAAERGLTREAVRLTVGQNRARSDSSQADIPWNLLIGAGRALTTAPHPGDAAMLLLDGVEPWGVTSLAIDVHGVTTILGAIAAIQPIAAVDVAALDAFLNLGTVIAPIGHSTPGKTALKLKITYDVPLPSGEETIELEVPYGAIEIAPLPPGQKATLELRPGRNFDLGLGRPGRGAVTVVEGGALGVIIDARGRPLRLPQDDAQRRGLLEAWQQKLRMDYATTGENH